MRKALRKREPYQLIEKKRPGESETNPAPDSVGEFWSKHTDVREWEREREFRVENYKWQFAKKPQS